MKTKPLDAEAQEAYDRASAEIAEAVTDHRSAALERHIREVVDAAPPLTRAQRDRLATLLRGDS